MRTILAAVAFLVSALMLGFVAVVAADAAISWGIREALITMFYGNAIIFVPCLTCGAVSFLAGLALLGGHSRSSPV